MDDEDADQAECRPPTLEDLLGLCKSLNEQGAKYIVIGGIAIIQHGFPRATQDIDLLVDDSLENQTKVKKALEILPDKAIRELGDDDLRDFVVVRVADEILVDLMLSACGISYDQAKNEVENIILDGVLIPFANPSLLLRMKQTYREKDAEDRIFLHEKLNRLKPKG
jgi:hypothetical protein